MWGYVLSVLGLSVLCGLWVVFQRWIARLDPGAPGVEGRCGNCGQVCEVPEAEGKAH